MLQTDDPIYHGPLTRLLKQRCFFHMHVLRVVVQTRYVITILHIWEDEGDFLSFIQYFLAI